MKVSNRLTAGALAVATAFALSTVPASAAGLFSMSSGSSVPGISQGGNSGGGSVTNPGGGTKLDNVNKTVNLDGVMVTPFEAQFVKELNAYRTSKGLNPLKAKSSLFADSRTWSKTMASEKRMYHSEYNVWENVAYNGSGDPTYLLNQWKNSPGHNRAMLTAGLTSVGFAQSKGDDQLFYATLQMI